MRKKKEEKQELRNKNVYVRGVLVDAFFGKRTFGKEKDAKDKYRISIKANADDMASLAKDAAPYYEDTEEKWRPKWLTDPKSREFLNLASNYDIKAGYKNPETGNIDELGFLNDYIVDNGNINGSKVVIMLTLKAGAIYPASILIKELKTATIADMFANFEDNDELPFV